MNDCTVDLQYAQAIWDDTGIDWDGYQRDWDGKPYCEIESADWNDTVAHWNSALVDWEGKEIELINVLQMRSEPTDPWTTLDPSSFEYQLITEHWADVFPFPQIQCWGVEYGNGMTVYYRWIQMNACQASFWTGIAPGTSVPQKVPA